jgi:uncharacterized protein YuzE
LRRLTTPTHTFALPFDASAVDKFLLTYAQDEAIVLEKTEVDMDVNGHVWGVKLTQEETKLFKPGTAFAQIRVLMVGGDALASEPMRLWVDHVFNEEVLA